MIQSSAYDQSTMSGQHFAASRSNPAVAQLQQALAALATVTRDRTLALKADGVAGPVTATAVNRAFTVHIGPGQAPATFRTGKLPLTTIVNQASALTSYVATEARRRGASAPAPGSAAYLQEMANQIRQRVPSAQVGPARPAGAVPPSPGPAYPPTPVGLQNALGYLARETGDHTLAVKPDGKIGPATAAAVNRALTAYVRAPGAASLKTGRLTAAQVKAAIATLVGFVSGEAASRHFGSNPPAAVPGTSAITTTAAAAAATSTAYPPTVLGLQNALNYLARESGAAISTKADGRIGPNTVLAVNRAMVGYVRATDATAYRTGKLTQGQVLSLLPQFVKWISGEAASRHFGSNPPAMASLPGPKTTARPSGPRIKPGRSAPLALLQTRLGQLGRTVGDTSLIIKVDGLTGPKTAAAVNRALQVHVSNVPESFKAGLSAVQVKTQAATLAKLVADEVAKRGTTPASAPPEGSDAVDSGGGGGGEPVSYETAPPGADDSGGEAASPGVGPAPVYTPSVGPAQPAYTPPSGGGYTPPGGEMIPGGGGGEMTPAPGGGGGEPVPGGGEGGGEPSKFPLVPVLIGVGVAAVITTIVVLAAKSSNKQQRPEPGQRRQPAYFPQPAAA